MRCGIFEASSRVTRAHLAGFELVVKSPGKALDEVTSDKQSGASLSGSHVRLPGFTMALTVDLLAGHTVFLLRLLGALPTALADI
ncbi:hypothetical protein J1605_005658 [Eschrichtius robustus]|uniref:Uncharacterized protein n=1 Tax=Eschrichtius robustus TaxID=9764 RepID=A0AB34H845_ESCRO|nr:hypothetical protein J1605_005658 [Eschrichtius robustus]